MTTPALDGDSAIRSLPARCSRRSSCGPTHALAEIATIVGEDPAPIGRQRQRLHEAMLAELWDPEAGRSAPSTCPAGARRGGRDRIVRSTARPRAPAGPGRGDRGGPAFRELPPRRADRLRRPELRPPRARASTRGATGAAPSGSTRTGFWQLASASTAITRWPTRSRAAVSASSRVSGFREYFNPFDGTGFGRGRLRLERGVDDRLHRAPASERDAKNCYALQQLEQAESPPHRPMPVGAGAAPLRAYGGAECETCS